VWIYDLAETTAVRRLTFDGNNRFPVWSPDSRYIAFQSDRGGDAGIFRQRADSTGVAERLTTAGHDTVHIPESWSAEHQVLSFSVKKGSGYSLWMLSLRDKQVSRFRAGESDIPTASTFSPNGRWIAYQAGNRSGESGRFQVTTFVEPFLRTGAIVELPGNAASPEWSVDGTKLFYMTGPPSQRVVVNVTEQPAIAIGIPSPVPNGAVTIFRPDWWRHYDLGRHDELIGLVPSEKSLTPGTKRSLYVVLNWFDELKRRIPVH
jgi:Tol biopolymer transport system component